MTENPRRNREISRREAEMSVAATHEDLIESIRVEMAFSVRQIGGDHGSAKDQNRRAARFTGLPITVIERLRWKKFQRVPADVADWVRLKRDQYIESTERLARHENEILKAQLAAARRISVGSSDTGDDGAPADQVRECRQPVEAKACERCERTGGADRSID